LDCWDLGQRERKKMGIAVIVSLKVHDGMMMRMMKRASIYLLASFVRLVRPLVRSRSQAIASLASKHY
jgi:hypothetical protein